jgi:hypothetical protein
MEEWPSTFANYRIAPLKQYGGVVLLPANEGSMSKKRIENSCGMQQRRWSPMRDILSCSRVIPQESAIATQCMPIWEQVRRLTDVRQVLLSRTAGRLLGKHAASRALRIKVMTTPIVAVGASADGLEAMCELFSALPPTTGAAFVVAQHLDREHKSLLAELLAKKATMPVAQIEDGLEPMPKQGVRRAGQQKPHARRRSLSTGASRRGELSSASGRCAFDSSRGCAGGCRLR